MSEALATEMTGIVRSRPTGRATSPTPHGRLGESITDRFAQMARRFSSRTLEYFAINADFSIVIIRID
jgi:hypothetical protein